MQNGIFKYLRSSLIIIMISFLVSSCNQVPDYVDDVAQARAHLTEQRAEVQAALKQEVTAEQLNRLVSLGSLETARRYLDELNSLDNAYKLVEARLWMKKHRYSRAGQNIHEVLAQTPENRDAILLQAKLYIQSWQLPKAIETADELLEKNEHNVEAGLIHGRVALLNRQYDKALKWAQQVQDWDMQHAGGYLLESKVHFWNQKPDKAEPALVRALELDPFNADARFNYGYAIWRRVDATQLDDMAAQWNLALEINPQHFLTNWHFGNGHTNLTYADYAQPSDSLVRPLLDNADCLIAKGNVDEAIAITRDVGSEHPNSVLPAMMRGSAFYMHYNTDLTARLDSAEAIFQSILERKKNYGPAHNGLAAVIKQRQFTYLNGYEQLEQEIENTNIPSNEDVFYEVFEDAAYYPGDRVKKLIAQQIGPSKAYLPMINKFDSDFAIPPLHIDLAEAMGSNYFRHGTTFDNRQWMDIRGVGSGATGIEYLERGAHWERNVLAHEYAHLYHGRILTDRESRRIRALYHSAMEDGQALDYYASNNESEYFAQGYAGFLSEKKVHPLSHKSMNTREYVKKEDPKLYAFLDSLIQKQRAYLSGNKEVFNDNWAQTHVSLAKQAEDNNPEKVAAQLDTALNYSPDYLPALLEYAELYAEGGQFDEANAKVAKAESIDNNYAPIYVTKANIIHQQALQDEQPFDEALEKQIPLLDQSYRKENDLAVRANINRMYRERLYDYGRVAKAIEVADDYVQSAPTISTYLRDRKEQAELYANYLRSEMGYADQVKNKFERLVSQNPQNFSYRRMYADVLKRAGQLDKAMDVLQTGQRILTSADESRPGYTLRIARLHILQGDHSKAEELIESIAAKNLPFQQQLLLTKIYIDLGNLKKSKTMFSEMESPKLPAERAAVAHARALLATAEGQTDEAVQYFKTALTLNPYHLKARKALIANLEGSESAEQAKEYRTEAKSLGLNLDP